MSDSRRSFLLKAGIALGMIGLASPLFARNQEYYTLSEDEQDFLNRYENCLFELKKAAEDQKSMPGDIDSGQRMMKVSEEMSQMHQQLDKHLKSEAFGAYFFHIVNQHGKEMGGEGAI